LRGTSFDISPKGKILFIEDIDEHHYHLDRMMMNLKAGKILEQISGLVVGYFTGMKDGETPFGRNAYQVVKDAVAPYKYPVVFGFQSGHELPNYPLLMGGRILLEVSDEKVIFKTL
jgi:muramoyltetrapeptide carboxypeptidase